jgi:hypothetical protein
MASTKQKMVKVCKFKILLEKMLVRPGQAEFLSGIRFGARHK